MKTLRILLLALALSGCEGAVGPTGPEGAQGEPGEAGATGAVGQDAQVTISTGTGTADENGRFSFTIRGQIADVLVTCWAREPGSVNGFRRQWAQPLDCRLWQIARGVRVTVITEPGWDALVMGFQP